MKILLLNYYWPPCGGPAVQRWLYIIKHLSELGFECHVLTVEPEFAAYPMLDETLNAHIPASAHIYKTKSTNFLGFYAQWFNKGKIPSTATAKATTWKEKMARFIRSNFFLPDPRRGWNRYALPKALQIIEQHQIGLVITAGPPHSTHLVGLKLKKQKNIIWIADLHDYWTNIAYLANFYRTPLASWIDSKMEKRVLCDCDAILTHCRSSKEYFFKKYALNPQKIRVHTIGYDEELFKQYEAEKNEFWMAYTGTIAGFYGVDAFFEALALTLKKINYIIKFIFVGKTDDYIQNLPKKYGLEGIVEFWGYLSHSESVRILKQCSALFLVNPICDAEKIHVPGKLYEYLAARKPIVNLAPLDSEVAQIIEQCQAGKTFTRNQVFEISNYLIELINNKKMGKPLLPTLDTYRLYGRKRETIGLAQWLKYALN